MPLSKPSSIPPGEEWSPEMVRARALLEKYAPWGDLSDRKTLTLQWQDIRPTIRYAAHEKLPQLLLDKRIIYDYLLVYFRSGDGICKLNGTKVKIKERELFLIPPFSPHQIEVKGPSEHLAVHFDWKYQFPRLSASKLLKREPYEIQLPTPAPIPWHQSLSAYDPIIELLQQITTEWVQEDVANLRTDAYLFEVIALLLERSQTPKNKSARPSQVNEARIEMAVELMEKNLTRKISREEITKATGLSYSHFSNLFHRQTGHSPMEYLSHLRIQKAKVLLEDLRLSIKEVSTLCGFDDPYYFSKVFTHLEARSPTQYREILAGNGITPKVHRKTSSKSRA